MPKTIDKNNVPAEAAIFARYFTGTEPTEKIKELYAHAISLSDAPEDHFVDFAVRNPWSIGLLDGGLVITDPHSEYRRRLYVMYAILESQPEFSHRFLPRQRGPLYVIVVGLVGIRAVLTSILGIILVKAVR